MLISGDEKREKCLVRDQLAVMLGDPVVEAGLGWLHLDPLTKSGGLLLPYRQDRHYGLWGVVMGWNPLSC